MSRQDRGRQQSFRFRLPSWVSPGSAPQRAPSQRQPSRVSTTSAQPPSPSAQGQPSSPQQPPQQPPAATRSQAARRPSSQPPPPSPVKPQMGTAPSRPASDTGTAPRPPSPSNSAPPRSQPRERPSQPAARAPSRQLSPTLTQPLSPSRPASDQLQATTPRVPSPPPPPPASSPEPPPVSAADPKVSSTPHSQPQDTTLGAPSPPPPPPTTSLEEQSPERPAALSITPSQAAKTPPAAPRPPSPSAKLPSQPQPDVPEMPEGPPPPSSPPTTTPPGSPTAKVLPLESPFTDEQKRQGREEETTAAPAQLQPQDTGRKDQAPTDSTVLPIELESPSVPEATDQPALSTGIPPSLHPSGLVDTRSQYPASETKTDRAEGQLTPTIDVNQKPTHVVSSSAPPKKPEIEGEKPVTKLEADQGTDSTLSQAIERKPEETEEEKRPADQPQQEKDGDPNRSKDMETETEDLRKEERPKITSPVPAPDKEPQVTTDSQEARSMEEADRTSGESDRKPTEVQIEETPPIKEVKASEAEQPVKQAVPPAPPSSTNGKEGKVAISTVARTSTSSREQSSSLHKEIKEGISRLVQNLAVRQSKHPGGAPGGISIITLAGENQGASMFVGNGTTREANVHVHKGPALGGGDVGEGGQKKTHDKSGSTAATTSTSVNSNVQTVNNSILHDSCCSEENPGVHVLLSTKSLELDQPEAASWAAKTSEIRKSRPRVPLPERLTNEPNVRRRCLRALFLEPSDDDAENRQKRRRHGCRFCLDKVKKGAGDQDEASGGINTQR